MEFVFPDDHGPNEPASEHIEAVDIDQQDYDFQNSTVHVVTPLANEPARALKSLQSLSITLRRTIDSIREKKSNHDPFILSFTEASIALPYYQIGKTDMRRVNLGLYTIYVFLASSWVANKLEFGFEHGNKVYTLDEASMAPGLAAVIRKTLPAEKFLFRFIESFDNSIDCAFANAIRAAPSLIQYPKGFYSLTGVFADPGLNRYLIDEALSYQDGILDGLVARGVVQRKKRFFSTSYQFSPTIIPVLTCLVLHVRSIMLSNFSSNKQDDDNEFSELDCETYKLAALYSAFSISKLSVDYDPSFQIPRANKSRLSDRVRMLASMAVFLWKSPTLMLQPENVKARDAVGAALLAEAMALGVRVSNSVL
ncbi:Hypothetical protein GLP15_3185 [Giardia lamblia P15]|uniref:Uncharacterized protein n=1 Tax=Giardia intestinalis (strain P15) TaxID=658858 RepID=E1F965_GIAIA|nr:Hypothetical protein GLP15_3185 [Giardia lamblia P15]